MSKTQTPIRWYASLAGNDHQGLVIDADSGATIAVTYDSKHAPLVAVSPNMLRFLSRFSEDDMRELSYDALEEVVRDYQQEAKYLVQISNP